MSDAPAPIDLRNEMVMLSNEYRRIQRQLETKTSQLAALVSVNAPAGDFPTDFGGARYRRYSIDFNFTPDADALPPPQEQSVQVDAGTVFRCSSVESFVRAVGSVEDSFSFTDVASSCTLPWDARVELFDFLWRIRDTGTDREWCDQQQPAIFLGGGYVGPLQLPRHIILGGGTTIYAEVSPFVAQSDPTRFFIGSGAKNVQLYQLQICFVGHDVPDDSVI